MKGGKKSRDRNLRIFFTTHFTQKAQQKQQEKILNNYIKKNIKRKRKIQINNVKSSGYKKFIIYL
jgi:hypothetical protein